MTLQKVFVSEFLNERKDRFKPDEANKTWLYRLEKIDFSWKIYISENKPTKTNMILVKKWDLVISWINVEKWALSVYEGNNDILATIHYSSYEYDKTKIDIEYLKWFLKSPSFQSLLLEQNGWWIKTEMKAKTFLKLKVFLPTLEEQKNILKIIQWQEKEILELEKIWNKNLSYIKQLKQAILQEAIEWKLTSSWRKTPPLVPLIKGEKRGNELGGFEPASVLLEKIKKEKEVLVKQKKLKKQEKLKEISEDEIPFEIPESWSWCRLDDLWIIKWWKRMPQWSIFSETKTQYLYLRVSDMKEWGINMNSLKYIDNKTYEILKTYIINDTDLYMTIVWGTIWKCGILPKECDWIILTENALKITPLFVNKYYIYHYLISSYAQNEFKDKTNQLWVQKLSMIQFKKTFFPLPPLEEQKEIVKKVDEMMKFCDELEKQSLETKENSENLMKSVLQWCF